MLTNSIRLQFSPYEIFEPDQQHKCFMALGLRTQLQYLLCPKSKIYMSYAFVLAHPPL